MHSTKTMDSDQHKKERFWLTRSTNYDKLFWTKDENYLKLILQAGDFQKEDIVLDVGTGTGIIAKKLKPYVRHLIGIDISEAMLKKGEFEGISLVKWDICDELFASNIFDKIVARMVFHHIVGNLDIAVKRCFDMLKRSGKIVVAEGMPPSDDPFVVEWYKEMFKLKEERLTFTHDMLSALLENAGFRNIKSYHYTMQQFNINNWLINSGINESQQELILKTHFNADKRVKQAYNMQIINGECVVDTKNVVLVGVKE